MSILDYQASRRTREKIEAQAYQASVELVDESIANFKEHLSWILCDLRNEKIHSEKQINEFEAAVTDALLKVTP